MSGEKGNSFCYLNFSVKIKRFCKWPFVGISVMKPDVVGFELCKACLDRRRMMSRLSCKTRHKIPIKTPRTAPRHDTVADSAQGRPRPETAQRYFSNHPSTNATHVPMPRKSTMPLIGVRLRAQALHVLYTGSTAFGERIFQSAFDHGTIF